MLPPSSVSPSSTALRPLPGRAVKSLTARTLSARRSASAMTALARGCSLFASSAAARERSSSSVTSGAGTSFVTVGSPRVMVPVLSRATMSTLPASSRETAVLNSTPFLAPMPLPTMMATGVARPSAQGQLITSTEMPRARA